ncbi:DUF1080 domain-containing protein [Yeosuana sp. MJ-SS3]|uniref:DUF1080 domain-containing protein n=1 Tax=Gilvirhabdus luticola TaxID=3079858 RepID=A0ABU3U3Y6_9FLAO|nr:DUF1080 domain-containing protein [Yeosuana sp. MJ-SS3]MDU8885115.1 DUF1080 domain-containing protein [Yeosuana sp. MJ-SS3]
MRTTLLILTVLFGFISCKNSKENISIDVDKEEWISLFNGKDLGNWEIKIAGHKVDDNYKNTFIVEDGILRVIYKDYDTFTNQFGHIYYKKPFSYYKVKLDYRFTGEQVPGGPSWAFRNSGIMLHSQSAASNSLNQNFPVSIEMQFLGGSGKDERATGNLCTPGTIVRMDDSINYNHCITSSSKTYHGDQWVHAEAIVLGDEKIIHIIESDTVFTYLNPMIGGGLLTKGADEEWKNNGVDNKEEWLAKDGQPLNQGYIALQAESHPVDFKNVELLDLCGCMDKKARNYKSYYVKADNTKCIYD